MSKFVVTGGAGFIGSNITKVLIEEGHTVKVIDNLSTGFLHNLDSVKDKITFIQGDILDEDLLNREFAGFDYCLHLAAYISVPGSMKNPDLCRKINVEGTQKVLEAAKKNGLKRLVLSSSSAVYGETQTGSNIEDGSVGPTSVYGETKLQGEKLCWQYAGDSFTTVVLRYFNVFGPQQNPESDYAAVIPKFISLMLKGQPPTIFGDGKQSRDFVFVRDVAKANILAATSSEGAGESYNIACGQSVNLNGLVETINRVLQSDLKPNYAPARVGDIKFSQADISKAKQKLNYSPSVNFEEGLKETIEWYKTKN